MGHTCTWWFVCNGEPSLFFPLRCSCIVVSPPYNIKCLNWLLLWFCINKIILNWIELNVLQSAVFGWSDFFTKHQWRLTHGLCCQTNLALFCVLGNIIVSLIAWYHYNTVYHRKSCIHTVKYVKNRSKFWKIEVFMHEIHF